MFNDPLGCGDNVFDGMPRRGGLLVVFF